ncbi:hypothetical protein PSEUDO9AG_40489 [Pseudomonas sp. 9Ag]|nr:hypothetical protein PSEUDO9AG_40489 [Pseudomonas sp. 9Ag]
MKLKLATTLQSPHYLGGQERPKSSI